MAKVMDCSPVTEPVMPSLPVELLSTSSHTVQCILRANLCTGPLNEKSGSLDLMGEFLA